MQADRAGNVFFFRAEELEVYPVTKAGTFGQPFRLETTAEKAGFVRDAVLSPAGDQWLVLADLSVRRFVDGKEKISPPLEWQPWAIGFRRDTPVVAVIPRLMGRVRDLDKAPEIPWLLTLGSERWDTLSRLSGMSPPQLAKKGVMNDVIAENSVNLASDREGRLWAARQYAYRVQRFSPGGRVLLEIAVDHGEVRRRKESQGVEIKLHGTAANPDATSNTKAEKAMYYPFTAEAVILDHRRARRPALLPGADPRGRHRARPV